MKLTCSRSAHSVGAAGDTLVIGIGHVEFSAAQVESWPLVICWPPFEMKRVCANCGRLCVSETSCYYNSMFTWYCACSLCLDLRGRASFVSTKVAAHCASLTRPACCTSGGHDICW